MLLKIFLILIPFTFFFSESYAQQKKDSSASIRKAKDTSGRKNILTEDSTTKGHNPKIAALRSALIPGWGQAYNKKYWKIPIIYGALGVTAGVFFYNLKTYKLLRQAVIYRSDTIASNDLLIDPRFIPLSTESIRSYRNYYRQNIDYSVLVFLVFWGLNIVDAVVDAHLKSFDVSNSLTLKIKPGYNPLNNTGGISLVFSFKNKTSKGLTSIP